MNTSTKRTTEQRSDSTRQKSANLQQPEHGGKLQKCMRINKPMIPLKISLFLWYGGGAIIPLFFDLYLLQLGISISQLSFIHALNPILQFVGPTISGIIADKIGRSKPVLIANIILVAIVINSVLLVPAIGTRNCFLTDVVELQCNPNFSVKNQRNNTKFTNNTLECFVKCNSSELLYHTLPLHESETVEVPSHKSTKSIPSLLKRTFSTVNMGITTRNATWIDSASLCHFILKDDCASFCGENVMKNVSWTKVKCPHVQDNSVLVVTFCTLISCLFSSVISICYRFMDVTSMFMVETYNSDFGRERFWSMLGVSLMSPFASYLIDLTTPEGQPRNCVTAIYFVDGVLVFLMVTVCKLDVRIYPPGRNIMRNVMKLLKNLDTAVFGMTLLVLGTTFSFTKIYTYIYLDRLGAPSILMGLMLCINSISGLPFLMTSNWWIRKIGTTNLLLCGFLGHVYICLGYSFLENPWHALVYETSAIFTYHLLWVAVVRHSHEVAPDGLHATVIASAGGIHWALGRGLGGLIGGQVMSKYGGRWAYRILAILCGFSGFAYGVFLYFRKNKSSGKLKPVPSNEE